MSKPLPNGYQIRPLTSEDTEALLAVKHAHETAALGAPDYPLEALRATLRKDPDLARNSWGVLDVNGKLVAGALIEPLDSKLMIGSADVVPSHTGRGIGGALLERIHTRASGLAAELPLGTRSVLHQVIYQTPAAIALLTAHGYTPVRRFKRMVITLSDGWPTLPALDGVSIRPVDFESDAPALHQAITAAFVDHWNSHPRSFEEWRALHTSRDDFDPSLWLVAADGDAIVGGLLGSHDSPEAGWIGNVGVTREYRGRGIAGALLAASFTRFAAVGKTTVGLGVDAESLTGATRVYERAGMHCAFEEFVMEYVVQPQLEDK